MIRTALPLDVAAMHAIRLSVRENQLSDPSVVTEQDDHDFMLRDTRRWVHELNGGIIGFVMVDVEKQNLWALFVAPEHEFKGVGRALHAAMISYYFTRAEVLRLSTAPHTRAAEFYRRSGYREVGPTADGKELIFELASTHRHL